ncbi:MAG TPA: GMP synthase (glutamine-hydrolyzing), partial [Cyanobacteria bacterium UBA8530]|nr:GMP synthase (glutamine-hydrolyzing) [Cyanobacteria bacterium UBA8530]
MKIENLAILDFGSQYTPLIARRVRELGVHAEIFPHDVAAADLKDLKGLILSGGPASVLEKNAPRPRPEILALAVPILGICYG